MITFLEYSFLEEIYHHISQQEKIIIDILINPSRYIQKLKPNRWKDIDNLGSKSIFDDAKSADRIPLIDISSLKINSKVSELVKSLQNNVNIYLYNPDSRKLGASDKQILKKSGIPVTTLKPLDNQIKLKLLEEYRATQKITGQNLSSIVHSASTLQEAFDILDVCNIYPNYLNTIKTSPQIQLFMQNFRPGDKKSINIWYNHTKEQEIQLAISLILTKLKKQNSIPTHIKRLIELDSNIKTHSKTKPITWYKLFLWQSLKQT